LLLASQPDTAAPSPSSGAATVKATPTPLTAAVLAASGPALPASAQPAVASVAAQPQLPDANTAPAGLVAGLEKTLATVPSPAPAADASAPVAPVASQPGAPAPPTVPVTTAAPGDIALLTLTMPPNGGAKTPATSANATPRDAATTATAPTDAAPNAIAPLSPAAVPAPEAPSNRPSDAAPPNDPKAAQDSAGKPDSHAPSAPGATAAAKTSAAGPSVAVATAPQPPTLPAGDTGNAGNAVNAAAGTTPAPDPSLAAAIAPPSVAPVADAHRAQVAYTAAANSGGALPQVTLDQVVLHLTKAADDGLDQLTIHLKPAELGAIEVKLEMGDGGLNKATISADRPDTLNLLQQDSHHLAQALDNAGIKTDPGSLSFNLRGDGGGRFAQGFAQGFAQQQGGGHHHAAPAYAPRTLNNSPLPDSTAILGYLNTRAALGGVDIRV
jgi:flagellar hook-length control protein FliK